MRLFLLFLLILCLTDKQGIASNPVFDINDSILLSEIEIVSARIYSLNDERALQPDTAFLQRNSYHSLQNVFAAQGGFYTRSAGAGLLTTSSIRGGLAVHTEVIWNGFSLISPMNGLTDFSLIPAAFFDRVEVVQGSNHAIAGTGGIGGSIYLNNRSVLQKGVQAKIGSNFGSFGLYNPHLDVSYNYGQGSLRVRSFYRQAKNNYSFPDPNSMDGETKDLENAASRQGGFLAEKYIRAGSNHRFAFRFWYQKAQREIPPTIFEQSSEAVQYDQVLRPQFEWNWHLHPKLLIRYAAFASDESNRYLNPKVNLDALNESFIFSQELAATWLLRENQKLIFTKNHAHEKGKSRNYEDAAIRNRISLQSMYRLHLWDDLLGLSVSGRLEHTSLNDILPSAAFGSQFNLIDAISISYNFNYNYRLPSFNDIFWEPGGNRELEPEKAISHEAAVLFSILNKHESHQLVFKPAVFYRDMTNFIQWRPGSQGYWEGFNIGDVISKGMEYYVSYDLKAGKNHALKLGGNYSYVRSYRVGDGFADKHQLIYVPVHTGNIFLGLVHPKYFVGIEWNYTGKRFLSADNHQHLEAYHTLDLSFQYSPFQKTHGLNLTARLNNILNHYYQNTATRPMPGFNFEAGISYLFNSKP